MWNLSGFKSVQFWNLYGFSFCFRLFTFWLCCEQHALLGTYGTTLIINGFICKPTFPILFWISPNAHIVRSFPASPAIVPSALRRVLSGQVELFAALPGYTGFHGNAAAIRESRGGVRTGGWESGRGREEVRGTLKIWPSAASVADRRWPLASFTRELWQRSRFQGRLSPPCSEGMHRQQREESGSF